MTLVEQEEMIHRIMIGVSFTVELNKVYMTLTDEQTLRLHRLADADIDRIPLVRE